MLPYLSNLDVFVGYIEFTFLFIPPDNVPFYEVWSIPPRKLYSRNLAQQWLDSSVYDLSYFQLLPFSWFHTLLLCAGDFTLQAWSSKMIGDCPISSKTFVRFLSLHFIPSYIYNANLQSPEFPNNPVSELRYPVVAVLISPWLVTCRPRITRSNLSRVTQRAPSISG